jgi:hypothetical protein
MEEFSEVIKRGVKGRKSLDDIKKDLVKKIENVYNPTKIYSSFLDNGNDIRKFDGCSDKGSGFL